ncbi:MAG: hypothetical protein HOV87_17825 [Catenulispora sp.]|nr:hypothetical protein [Catenulispora sp.]
MDLAERQTLDVAERHPALDPGTELAVDLAEPQADVAVDPAEPHPELAFDPAEHAPDLAEPDHPVVAHTADHAAHNASADADSHTDTDTDTDAERQPVAHPDRWHLDPVEPGLRHVRHRHAQRLLTGARTDHGRGGSRRGRLVGGPDRVGSHGYGADRHRSSS